MILILVKFVYRWTPIACDNDNGTGVPAYEPTRHAFFLKKKNENAPSHIKLNWENGNIPDPPTRMGMMNLEFLNKLTNTFNIRKTGASIVGTQKNVAFYVATINNKTNKYWSEQDSKNTKKSTIVDRYPIQHQRITDLYNNTLNLQLFKDNFHKNYTDGGYRLMPVIYCSDIVNDAAYDEIIKNNLINLDTKDKWSNFHYVALKAYIQKYDIKSITNEILDKLYTFFEKHFDTAFLNSKCKSLHSHRICKNLFATN